MQEVVMLDIEYRIRDKKDLKRYLLCDKIALNKNYKKPRFMRDYIWRFQILLRKTEYWSNQKSLLSKVMFYFFLFRYKRRCRLNCVEIPLNCIREGLTIWHLQNIIINHKCSIGYNFSISAGVIIGQAKGIIPIIGNSVMIMVNSSVLGASLCDEVAIGAHTLVIKNISEKHSVWVGYPAKKNSNNYPLEHLEKGKNILLNLLDD